jgi:hypothetical protein
MKTIKLENELKKYTKSIVFKQNLYGIQFCFFQRFFEGLACVYQASFTSVLGVY